MSVGSAIGGAEETVDLVAVLAVLGVLIYLWYKYPDIVQSIKDDFSVVGNAVYTPSFPGGGETAGTSETYSGALDETLKDPAGVVGQIIGQNCFTCSASDVAVGTCNVAEYGQQVCL
jgi:hypothetical protein